LTLYNVLTKNKNKGEKMLNTGNTRHERLIDSLFGNNWVTKERPHMRAELTADTQNSRYQIQREEGQCTIVVPVPGAKREEINVTLDGGVLTVSCESDMGFGFKAFQGAFRTTEGTTEEHVQASYEDGILRVAVREPEVQDTSKQIPVN